MPDGPMPKEPQYPPGFEEAMNDIKAEDNAAKKAKASTKNAKTDNKKWTPGTPPIELATGIAVGAGLVEAGIGLAQNAMKGREQQTGPEPARPDPTPEVVPVPATPASTEFSKLTVARLQSEIQRADPLYDAEKLMRLRAEKQRRVDSLAELYEKKMGGPMSDRIEGIIRNALDASTPAVYQEIFEKAQKEKINPIGNPEADLLFNIVVTDELDRTLEKIYIGANESQDPPVNKADSETLKSKTERVKKSRVESGVHVDNPIDILDSLPPTFGEWEQQYKGFAADVRIKDKVKNYYANVDEEKTMRKKLLDMQMSARGDGYGRPTKEVADGMEEVNPINDSERTITEKTMEMWGFPPYFMMQKEIGHWTKVNTANVIFQIMERGGSNFENAMWGSDEFAKAMSEGKLLVSIFGLNPFLKLCSDGARNGEALIGSKDAPGGNMGKYGVNEILTSKFLLLDENEPTRRILDALFVLGGHQSSEFNKLPRKVQHFIHRNTKVFKEQDDAPRVQSVNNQKTKLVNISNELAIEMGVDRGLVRICLEFFELMGEAGFNTDLGRLKNFYYNGGAGSPRFLRPLPVNLEDADKYHRGKVEDFEKTIDTIKVQQLGIAGLVRQKIRHPFKEVDFSKVAKPFGIYGDLLGQKIRHPFAEVDNSKMAILDKDIADIKIQIRETKKENVGALVQAKIDEIQRTRLEELISKIGAKEDAVGKATGTEKDELKKQLAILKSEKDNVAHNKKYVQNWASDIIKRYEGDVLYTFFGMVDKNGDTVGEEVSAAIGILNRPLYIRAEEDSALVLRPLMSGVLLEKGPLSIAEGLAKGGMKVALKIMESLGAPKVAAQWGVVVQTLKTMDKVSGWAQRRDAEFSTLDEVSLFDQIKKEMDALRLRLPLTIISPETYKNALMQRIHPPVNKAEQQLWLAKRREAIQRTADSRKADVWGGLADTIRSLFPF